MRRHIAGALAASLSIVTGVVLFGQQTPPPIQFVGNAAPPASPLSLWYRHPAADRAPAAPRPAAAVSSAEWVQAPCAFLTECDARDLESSMQRYQLTPQDYDRMQLVRSRINQGLASGQWDASLFTPQSPPPGYRRWGP